MYILEILQQAIKQKRQISYEYDLLGKAQGKRYGDPHAIFTATTKNMNIHIYKQDGVCSDSKPLPGWREYKVKHIINVKILDKHFEVAPGYNPNSSRYINVFEKI
ncbi:hypothetical protein GCM10007424_05910 [Flavobacterium suaedae]|uniref:WYL domain-containing protein n=1 Tax=Flavobacterium suaedae TaxID=1767027 RepID=A0ABQ1JHQ8_9FLAO|nr:hypothetical protein [Flavobacterium suaedae]GGB68701.1 hypothetical protein GCM10007424_05910 [Flavobacterium suaedae]